MFTSWFLEELRSTTKSEYYRRFILESVQCKSSAVPVERFEMFTSSNRLELFCFSCI